MAIHCDDCRRVFLKERMNCPFCGGDILVDNVSAEQLINEGYKMDPDMLRWRNAHTTQQQHQAASKRDYYDEIRDLYESQYVNRGAGLDQSGNGVTVVEKHDSKTDNEQKLTGIASAPDNKVENHTATNAADQDQSSTGKAPGFFESIDSDFSQNIPTIPRNGKSTSDADNVETDWLSQQREENRHLRELQREQNTERRRVASRNRARNISWGGLGRFLLILIIVGAIIGIWTMRYAIIGAIGSFIAYIFSSVSSFLIACLPTVLVIAAMIWLLWALLRGHF